MDHKFLITLSWAALIGGIMLMLTAAIGYLDGASKVFLLGALLAAIGAWIIATRAWIKRKHALLRQFGTLIQAQFQRVERNPALEIQGANPYRMVAQWQDTSGVFVFRSANLWFDPSEFIQGRSIAVYIDPSDPTYYCVDLSFLPTLRS
jgi:hypothetical protein